MKIRVLIIAAALLIAGYSGSLMLTTKTVGAFPAGTCLPLPTGGTAWYRGENNGLSTIGTADAATEGGVSYVAGKVGNAFSLDGIDDGVVIPTMNIGDSYTIEMWIRIASAPGGFDGIFGSNAAPNTVGTLFVLSDRSLRYQQQGVDRVSTAGSVVSFGNYHHLALTRDSADSITRIYVDGTLVGSSSPFAAAYNNQLALGRGISAGGSRFNGIIDEVGIFGRALDVSELQAITAADLNGKCDTAPLRIAPASVSRPFGGTQTFGAVGGTPPYIFSIFSNISGASINSSTGLYTAGNTIGQDIVRVTDSVSANNDAFVSVTATCSGSERVWDGGGSTNNWSDAWNWCNDQVPPAGTGVRFNSTSTKDVNIDVSPSTGGFIIEAGYTGTITVGTGNTLTTGAQFEQYGGTFNAGAGNFTQQFGAVVVGGGTFNGGSGTLTIPSLSLSGGLFDAGSSTHNAGSIVMTGGQIVFTSATMTVTGSFFRSGGTGDFDNGTVIASGGLNQALEGIYGSVNNLTVNKSDAVGISTLGTVNVLGTLSLIDGIINGSGMLEARGPVVIESTFGNSSSGGGGGNIALRSGAGPRTITLPVGSRLPALVVDDAQVLVNTDGLGTINLDDLTLNAGAVEIGVTDLIVGYTTGVAGSHYTQTGGSFNISNGNIIWNTAGNFTMSNGTFNAGSGNVTLGGGQFIMTGGTFTPSTDANTFGSSIVSAFSQSGGVFAAGNGSVDVNGAFNLSGGTFNAPAGNMFVGFNFTHTAGTFNHNRGTLIFDSSHPSYGLNLPGNPGTGQFHDLVFALTTDNASVALSSDTWVASGDITIVNGQVNGGILRPEGDLTVESGADGGNAEIRFAGTTDQLFANNGGVIPSGTLTVDKTAGTVTASTDLLLGTSQALNIVAGTLYLNDGSDLRAGNVTIGTNGRLVNDSSTTITLGGNVANSGRIDLQGGGADCPGDDQISIRSSVPGTQRQWNGAGTFRIVDADIQDMAGSAGITAYSSTDSGNVGANWTFNSGCPSAPSISPETISLYRGQTQSFIAGGGFAPRAFSMIKNNSGGSINPTSGLYTAGNTMNVTDTIRVTDAFGSTADAMVNVIPGPPTRLVFSVQPSNGSAGQAISPAIQVAVQDNNGNTIPNATNAVTLNLLDNPGGSTLSGTVTRNAVDGVATFNDISLDKVGNGYTVQAGSTGLTGAVSAPFNIAAGTPARLAFDQQPTNVYPNTTFQPSVSVVVLDGYNNRVTTAVNPVTLSLGNNPGGGTLVNGGPRIPINGFAVFPARIESFTSFGSGYTLIASSPGLVQDTSLPFDVLSPFVVVNTDSAGPGSLRSAIGTSNATPGHQTVSFDIPGSPPFVINWTGSDALAVTDPVTIDGTTQPGYSGSPVIELNGNTSTALNPIGILLKVPNNTVKGLSITNFGSEGIRIANTSHNNTILGNYIGVNALGATSGYNHVGLAISSPGNVVGGQSLSERNVISGNNVGIYLFSDNNIVRGNLIGTAPDGISPLPNMIGISLPSGQNNTIGGDSVNDANTIAFNSNQGVQIKSGAHTNRIAGNSIYSNGGLGIDVDPFGVNANDGCDPDSGPNRKQNFPLISSAILAGGGAEINASLNSAPNQTFTIDYYANPISDPSGYGEGKKWIGSQTVSTGSNCSTGTFTFNAPSVPADTTNITATATDSLGNTSEFSQAKGALISISGTVRTSVNDPVAGVSVELRNSISTPVIRNALTDSAGRFVIPGLNPGDNYFVSMTKANHTFSPPTRTYTALTTPADDNYTANVNYLTISGKVSTNGVGVSGVTVTLSGAASRTATTDSAGNYAFSNLLAGIYTVTPSRTGFTFTPGSSTQAVSVNIPINFSAVNIQAGLAGSILFNINNEYRRMKADGSGVVTLFQRQSSDHVFFSASLSKDGTKIALEKQDLSLQDRELVVSNFDGSAEAVVGSGVPFGYQLPKWSLDKSKIAYSKSGSAAGIYVINSGGGNPTQITFDGSDSRPQWSSDGTNILFFRNSSIERGTYKVNSAGGTATLFMPQSTWTVWAPNNSKIAYLHLNTYAIESVNIDGSGPQTLYQSSISEGPTNLDYSPDSQRLLFTFRDANQRLSIRSVLASAGGSPWDHTLGRDATWGATATSPLVPGTNVNAALGNVKIQFSGIPFSPEGSNAISFDPIAPISLGNAPLGYSFTQIGYELEITGSFTPPANVCITIPVNRYASSAQFQRLRLLHFTGGSFADLTALPNNETDRTICGDASLLGGFVVAELIDTAMPSIVGQVVDTNGEPIADHLINLSGDEDRMTRTDHEGLFTFTNLNAGGSYNVTPNQHGYLFDISSAGFDAIAGENTVVFRGLAAQFTVSGSVSLGDGTPVAGVEVTMSGDGEQTTTTDPNGKYQFADVAANSVFEITARPATGSPTPASIFVGGLSNDLVGQDFVLFSPTAASVSVGGRVFGPDGRALRNATVSVTAPDGSTRTAITGSFGYFRIEGLNAGSNYVVGVRSRRYRFDSVIVNLDSDREDLVFVGQEQDQAGP